MMLHLNKLSGLFFWMHIICPCSTNNISVPGSIEKRYILGHLQCTCAHMDRKYHLVAKTITSVEAEANSESFVNVKILQASPVN